MFNKNDVLIFVNSKKKDIEKKLKKDQTLTLNF